MAEDKDEGLNDKKNLEEPLKDGNTNMDRDTIKSEDNDGLISEGKAETEAIKNKDVMDKDEGEKIGTQSSSGAKAGKKKIVKRVVKKMVPKRKDVSQTPADLSSELQKESAGEKTVSSEADGQQEKFCDDSDDSELIKNFVGKNVLEKLAGDACKEEVCSTDVAKTAEETLVTGNEPTVKPQDSISATDVGSSKTTPKKKVVKRLGKRKATQASNDSKQAVNDENPVTFQANDELTTDVAENPKKEINSEAKKEDEGTRELASGSAKKPDNDNSPKLKEEVLRNGSERKQNVHNESRNNSNKVIKGKKKNDEPPRHPGLFLQTKRSKEVKLESLSISLDSLLDYNDKDVEESSFEVSLFAETFYEMLQYEMGCCLLSFLQKVRSKFVAKRNLEKRQRGEISSKESSDTSSRKRIKIDPNVEIKLEAETTAVDATKDETDVLQDDGGSKDEKDVIRDDATEDVKIDATEDEMGVDHSKDEKDSIKTDTTKDEQDMITDDTTKDDKDIIAAEEPKFIEPKLEDELFEEPDEEMLELEDIDEDDPLDEDLEEVVKGGEEIHEEIVKEEKNASVDAVDGNARNEQPHSANLASETTNADVNYTVELAAKSGSVEKFTGVDAEKLLLACSSIFFAGAFRFFDRNRVGYIRVEDLRVILHNLGMYLSHRDVKELVQSALLESNTGRDDKILYDKLVKMIG
ncbi:hypothetical protein M569_07583 [Genlisea aurea]|uniref:EF-hand domain-containing protein n=1 Tax=Genlisea aurea TaxID=192259 RepID=S8DVH4_9LAMI|nr:hypothetical protein M569_07583 [Genlisea aurea]